MQMRVAFSVATAIRPEILIIDEALSVGDSYFQHKSFSRIKEFQRAGTTLLIVSHDRGAIQALCSRAILLDGGTIIKDGTPESVMDYYNAIIAKKENSKVQVTALPNGGTQTQSGTGRASIEQVILKNTAGDAVEYVSVGEEVCLSIRVRVNDSLEELVVGYVIKDRLGQDIFGTNTHHLGCTLKAIDEGQSVTYNFRFNASLGVGSYSVAVALHAEETHVSENYEWRDLALVFNVANISKVTFLGSAWLPPTVECV
jgi:lipopolysaccharide transport system ATP-binding protein